MINFRYLGYHKYDIYTVMALDEVLLREAEHSKDAFVYFYDFKKRALVLAYNEDPSDIRHAGNGVDITRRLTQGSVILCDKNVLGYSIILPGHAYEDQVEAHRELGKRIGTALHHLGIKNIALGSDFSVRIDGKTVAGHGQRRKLKLKWEGEKLEVNRGPILYHGVMAVGPWDVEFIDQAIALQTVERDGAIISERDYITTLPHLSRYISIGRVDLVNSLLAKITDGNYISSGIEKRVLEEVSVLRKKYRSPLWVNEARASEDDRLPIGFRSMQGFCFLHKGDDASTPPDLLEMRHSLHSKPLLV